MTVFLAHYWNEEVSHDASEFYSENPEMLFYYIGGVIGVMVLATILYGKITKK